MKRAAPKPVKAKEIMAKIPFQQQQQNARAGRASGGIGKIHVSARECSMSGPDAAKVRPKTPENREKCHGTERSHFTDDLSIEIVGFQ